MAGAANLIVTRERDALHRADPARPARVGDFARGVNGVPGHTVCGRSAAVRVNDLAAASLYPSLQPCGACA